MMPDKLNFSIARFWSRLSGSVHPEDEAVFDAFPDHSFNLEFPPPAFIGDVESAPIVVLMSNGGYKKNETESEFPDQHAISEYTNYISGNQHHLPARVSAYYLGGPFGDLIQDGVVALVNAVAYRSPKLSSNEESYNRRLAENLPSLEAHRRWLMQEVLPKAHSGERLVLVHRKRWWKIDQDQTAGPNVIFSDPLRAEPNRPSPDKTKIALALDWLRQFELRTEHDLRALITIKRKFDERFKQWQIRLPNTDIANRRSGHISSSGWSIQYCFGIDEEGEFLDYYAGHRMMFGEEHTRIRLDGTEQNLPAPFPAVPFGKNDVETRILQAEYSERNREIRKLLKGKGFK